MKNIIVCGITFFLSACSAEFGFSGADKIELKDSRSAKQWYQQGSERVQKRKADLAKI